MSGVCQARASMKSGLPALPPSRSLPCPSATLQHVIGVLVMDADPRHELGKVFGGETANLPRFGHLTYRCGWCIRYSTSIALRSMPLADAIATTLLSIAGSVRAATA